MSIQDFNEIPVAEFNEFIDSMIFENDPIVETIECPICMDPIEQNKNSVVTECGHKFHCSCLMKNSCHNGFDCPLCRSAMVEDIADEDGDDEENDDEESYDSENDSDENSETEEDEVIRTIVIEDFDELIDNVCCYYSNTNLGRYSLENSVMLMLKFANHDELLEDFDRFVINNHHEQLEKVFQIYKRTLLLNEHFRKHSKKIAQNTEQELFAKEDINVISIKTVEKPALTIDDTIQKIKNVMREIGELNSYANTLMKQITPEIFHNKHQRTNIIEFLKTFNSNKPRSGKICFTENKNLIDEALNLLESKEKNM